MILDAFVYGILLQSAEQEGSQIKNSTTAPIAEQSPEFKSNLTQMLRQRMGDNDVEQRDFGMWVEMNESMAMTRTAFGNNGIGDGKMMRRLKRDTLANDTRPPELNRTQSTTTGKLIKLTFRLECHIINGLFQINFA